MPNYIWHVHEVLIEVLDELESSSNAHIEVKVHLLLCYVWLNFNQTPC